MRRWAGRAAAAIGIWALCFTAGCGTFFVYTGTLNGGGTTTPGTGDYVYVANATTQTLAGFSVGTGTLTAVSGSPYSLGFVPTALAVNPTNTLLFVGGNNAIYAYAIDSGSGALSALNSGSAVGLASAASMDVSPNGQWLAVLDKNNITVDEFQITNTSTGALAEVATPNYPVLPGATVVAQVVKFAPNGNTLFAALGTAGYVAYAFNSATGALSNPVTPQTWTLTTSAQSLAITPDSLYLYLATSGASGGSLTAYSIVSGGLATLGSPVAAGSQPVSVVLNKAGTDVYVANQQSSNISGYSINASNGTLMALNPATNSATSPPLALAVDNSGTYLLAIANGGNPDLAMYSYDSTTTGKLDFSTSAKTGNDPTGPIAVAATH